MTSTSNLLGSLTSCMQALSTISSSYSMLGYFSVVYVVLYTRKSESKQLKCQWRAGRKKSEMMGSESKHESAGANTCVHGRKCTAAESQVCAGR